MIEFRQVSKVYQSTEKKKQPALQAIDLKIAAGEMFGLVGASGSGKSTFLKLINALEWPTSGRLLVDKEDFQQLSSKEKKRKRQQIGIIFQEFNLLHNLTVAENIGLPLKLQGKEKSEKVQQVLKFVGLRDKAENYPSQLSGGQKQRVAIARALSIEPSILLCDEPTSALDDQNAFEIMSLLKTAQKEFGTTVVIVSHQLEVIRDWCQRAAILEKGQLQKVLTLKEGQTLKNYPSFAARAEEVLQ